MQVNWHAECQWPNVETAFHVYKAMLLDESYTQHMFHQELSRRSYTTMTWAQFETLTIQNDNNMSAVDVNTVNEIVKTGFPSQSPLILAYIGGRVVILNGHTQLRAAEILKSDVRFIHIETQENGCFVPPSQVCVIL